MGFAPIVGSSVYGFKYRRDEERRREERLDEERLDYERRYRHHAQFILGNSDPVFAVIQGEDADRAFFAKMQKRGLVFGKDYETMCKNDGRNHHFRCEYYSKNDVAGKVMLEIRGEGDHDACNTKMMIALNMPHSYRKFD